MTKERQTAVYRFTDLYSETIRERAQQAWDNDAYVIVDARPVTKIDRTLTEAWLIRNGVPYHEVVYGG